MQIIHALAPIGAKTAVALGYFDGFHLGHRAVLETVLKQADTYHLKPALLTFDMSARRAEGKGGRDLFSPARKAAWAQQMGFVYYVEVDFGAICDLSAADFVEQVLTHRCMGAAVVSCGEDFRFGKGRAGDVAALTKLCGPAGIRVLVLPGVLQGGAPVSTTRIKQLVEAGDMPAAAKLLGRPYDIVGEVIHGNHMGHRFGFPTANIALPPHTVLPRSGVYLSQTLLDGVWLRSISNIGVRPTVTQDVQPVSETHLVDYAGEQLYGRTLEVRLLRFLRPEQKFSSEEQLRETVLQNIEYARTVVLP